MLTDLDPAQRALANLMSDISERGQYAGWMEGLEYALWSAVAGGARGYGHTEISDVEISELRRLSSECNGWIMFHPSEEECFVPLSQWVELARAYSGTGA